MKRRPIDGASVAPETPNDAKRLRDKADQARADADNMTDPLLREAMLDIAVCYIVLAQSADEHNAVRLRD